MELLKVSISLIIAVLMMKFQPKTNNEKLVFVGLVFVVSFLLTKDIRNSLLIVVISYLLHNILKENLGSITKMFGLSKENFSVDSDDEDEEEDESEEENFSGSESGSEEEETDDEGDETDDED
jgi:hypothetical protein